MRGIIVDVTKFDIVIKKIVKEDDLFWVEASDFRAKLDNLGSDLCKKSFKIRTAPEKLHLTPKIQYCALTRKYDFLNRKWSILSNLDFLKRCTEMIFKSNVRYQN